MAPQRLRAAVALGALLLPLPPSCAFLGGKPASWQRVSTVREASPAEAARDKLLAEVTQRLQPAVDKVESVAQPVLSAVQPLRQQLSAQLGAQLAQWGDASTQLPLPEPLAVVVKELAALVDKVDAPTAPLLLMPVLLLSGQAMIDAARRAVGESSPYDSGENSYDYRLADKFFGERMVYVGSRAAELMRLTTAFNIRLLLDWRLGNLEKNEKQRAREALVLASQLGPTFIKLGQALSIRTDLIPEAYALELRQLQDAVPPFNSEVAREIVRRELGVKDLSEVFLSLSPEPVASASIGQVYRGTLLDGREVAVKVQRPGVLAEIALDLFLLRKLTPAQVAISNAVNKLTTSPEDIDTALALVDEWGRGFVAEVDYLSEAQKQKEFTAAMERRGLGAVTAPSVVDEFSSSRVLVTEWVQGTRLDKDASPDVPRLCGVAINAYLTMLLDTGCLHCDPHPGNLLRTTDGRLCILDWGMTLQVPSELQYAVLEFIAHVNSEDYDAIPADFVNLGFTPPDQLDRVRESGITEGLSFTLRQLSKGGGAKQIQQRVKAELQERYGSELDDEQLRQRARDEMISRFEEQLEKEGVDVSGVTNIMEEMSKRNRELFSLPPYVLYVTRAFSTLEGIGLSIDENYSILQECYPYLARRLLTDSSPRAKKALKSMLYGPEGDASPSLAIDGASPGVLVMREGVSGSVEPKGQGLLSPEKLVEMSEGFTSYTTATAEVNAGMDEAREALTELLLSSQGNYVQELLVEEAAKVVDALLRDRVGSAFSSAVDAIAAPKALIEANVPAALRPFALPVILPGTVAEAVKPLLAKTQEDEEVLKVAETLVAAFNGANDGNSEAPQQQMLSRVSSTAELLNPNSQLWTAVFTPVSQNLPAVAMLTRKFGAALLGRVSTRLEQSTAQQMANGEVTEEVLRMRSLAKQALGPIVDVLDEQPQPQRQPPVVSPASYEP